MILLALNIICVDASNGSVIVFVCLFFVLDEAYNELASQTENFAIRVQKAKSNFSEKSSPSPAFSHGWKFKNREKNFWNTSGESSRLLPIGKVAPEPKKHDPKLLGNLISHFLFSF